MRLELGDCLEVLKTIPDNSVDSIVTDPPYGLSFMNKKWDYDVPSTEIWMECLRVLKPGGHLLSFGGSRTYHRMAVRIEDAGFEIRDQIMWVYGSGFPKSHNIGKAVDKILGNEREVVAEVTTPFKVKGKDDDGVTWNNKTFCSKTDENGYRVNEVTKGTSEWEGWGTALKPAHEPIVMARKPLSEKTVADNVLRWGTGGINIDDSRIEYKGDNDKWKIDHSKETQQTNPQPMGKDSDDLKRTHVDEPHEGGRWPANIIFDEEAGIVLDQQSGIRKSGGKKSNIKEYNKNRGEFVSNMGETYNSYEPNEGGASRFFYCPKASKKDRDEDNNHPTVKPTDLMLYLIKLVTPVKGVVLDPFMGSGSTGKGAIRGGFDFIGIEREEEYLKIAEARIKNELNG
jgi:DNA modification methylase